MSLPHPVQSRCVRRPGIPHLRWWIAIALFCAAVLNYMDRNIVGILAPTIQQELNVSDADYAGVINWFLVAYTCSYLFSGSLVDKLGVRMSLGLFVGWWSISNALTGLAQGARSLSVFRFMLGLGEAGCWTASPKAVAEWFPPAERGVAVGLYSIGGAMGATLAPILVSTIAPRFGWRWVFAASPVLAMVWLAIWLWLYAPPSRHSRLTEKEREIIKGPSHDSQGGAGTEVSEAIPAAKAWKRILREPVVWVLMLGRLMTDPVWYFFQFWMAKYLHTARGVDQKGLSILWLVFLAADIGFLAGGFLAGILVKQGAPPPAARLRMMLCAACIVPISILIPAMSSIPAVIALAMLVCFALTCWLGNLTALVVDVVPKPILGTGFGLIACGSAMGGIIMNRGVAWLIEHRSYDNCFYIGGVMHLAALAFLWNIKVPRASSAD